MRKLRERNDWRPAQLERLAASAVARTVDVHCHCLPGIDDGPATLQDALRLCSALADDGFTTILATPHQLGTIGRDNTAEQIRRLAAELQEALDREGTPLEVYPGADVRIDDRLLRLLEEDQVLTTGDLGAHLLLELPHEHFIDPVMLFEPLLDRAIQPIMTHPERHRYLRRRLDAVESWVQQGALVQVTAGSLIGDFGDSAFQMGWALIDEGLVHLIATDAHNATRRPPCMTQAIAALSRQAPEWAVRRMCLENPFRVLTGEPVTPGVLSE